MPWDFHVDYTDLSKRVPHDTVLTSETVLRNMEHRLWSDDLNGQACLVIFGFNILLFANFPTTEGAQRDATEDSLKEQVLRLLRKDADRFYNFDNYDAVLVFPCPAIDQAEEDQRDKLSLSLLDIGIQHISRGYLSEPGASSGNSFNPPCVFAYQHTRKNFVYIDDYIIHTSDVPSSDPMNLGRSPLAD